MTAVDTDRAEWLQRRRAGIGGSDVAGILGLSPWASPWSIWADKVGLIELDTESTPAQEFGTRAEPMLKLWFEDETGLIVRGTQAEYTDPQRPWMRVTLDGEAWPPGWSEEPDARMLGVVEYKATSEPPSAWADGPPVHYQCQASWAMAITGARRVWFGVLHIAFGRPAFRVYLFERDDEDITTIVEACDRFWHDHVLTGIPPAADGTRATTDAIAAVYTAPTEDTVETDDDLAAWIDLLHDAERVIEANSQVVDEAKNRIRAALGDATVLTRGVDGKGAPVIAATWRQTGRTTLDGKALKAAHPELAAEFERTTTTRSLLVKRPKTAA